MLMIMMIRTGMFHTFLFHPPYPNSTCTCGFCFFIPKMNSTKAFIFQRDYRFSCDNHKDWQGKDECNGRKMLYI